MKGASCCAWLTVFVFALSCATAQAGTINVAAGDAAALVAAINTANGTGEADTLNVSGTYSFSAANNFWYGPNALPAITSDITIAGSLTSGAVITNTNGTRLRFFYVSGGRSGLTAGTLRLQDLELSNGVARGGNSSFGGGGAGLGGAIYNQGSLQVQRVTLTGNQALGGNAQYIGAAVDAGGGMGQNASTTQAGGFGGATPGVDAGAGGTGGPAGQGGGGGGGGYGATDDGGNGATPTGGVGGGAQNGLGGANTKGVRGGNGSGAGGTASNAFGPTPVGAAGGAFGVGGTDGGDNPPMGGGGGGGVGGGGGSSSYGGGSGGFGGGGAWSTFDPGNGGFGGGGGGVDNRVPALPAIGGKGGFGGGDAANPVAGLISSGGGGAGIGGAIFNDRGSVTLLNSTLTANTARGGLSQGIPGAGVAGEGGDGRGAALCSLNGTTVLTYVTIAANTAAAGGGAINGVPGGTICTIGYDSGVVGAATMTIRQSIVTDSGGGATSVVQPATLADGSTNRFTASETIQQPAFVGAADPQLAPLGDYGGPTRTMAPLVGSPVIDAATGGGLAAGDQRVFSRQGLADVGAVETSLSASGQITTSPTIPFSATDRNVTLTSTVSPARGTTSPGTVTFTAAGIASSASPAITGGTATTTTFNVPGNTPPGSYALSAVSSDSPGFLGRSAASGAVLRILNAPQVCSAVSASTAFDTAVTVTPSCTGAGPATVAVVGAPANGTATVVAGNLRYTPAPGFAGTDSFTYRTNNEGGDSNTATVTITVRPAPQVCANVTASTAFQTAVDVAASCTGAGPATLAVVGAPANGTATVVAGSLRYTPANAFAGTDSFTYRTTNDGGQSNTATVTVTVRNAPRVCSAVTATTPNATAVSVAPSCTGSGGGTLAVVGAPAHGAAAVVAGNLRYTPEAGYAGTDSFTYRVTNDGGPSNTATVTITVLNAPQVCNDVTASTPNATAVSVSPSCAGAAGTPSVVAAPGHGTAAIVGGDLRYTPEAGFAGTDSFTYRTTNNGGPSNTATVTITVAHPAPTCTTGSGEAGAGRARTLTLTCTSPIAQTFSIVDGPAHGTLAVLDDAAGTVVYTAADEYAGPDSFRYRSTSTSGPSNDATFTVLVKPRPTLTTAASGDIVLGDALTARATVAGRWNPQAGTTITFRLYGDAGCAGDPVFTSEQAADGDAASGSFTPTAAGTYAWRVAYSGDVNNLPVTGPCERVTVTAPAAQPAPAPAPAPAPGPTSPAAVCGDPVVLLDVAPTGARARVTGIARPASAGQTVTILRGTEAVGTATVGADGTFAATVAGRPRGAAGVLTYAVTLGSSRSQAFRYDRRLKIVRRNDLKVTGNLAVKKPPKFVTVYRIDVCTKQRTATRAKVSKTGTFTFTMRPRDAGTPYALYRVQAKIGRTSRSYSTQVAVTR